jgi:hypothetical protein
MDFASFFESVGAADVGFGVLVSFAVYLIFTGKLVPRSVVEQIRTDKDSSIARAVAETEAWKEAYTIEARSRLELGNQFGELLELAKTSDHALQSIVRRDGEK